MPKKGKKGKGKKGGKKGSSSTVSSDNESYGSDVSFSGMSKGGKKGKKGDKAKKGDSKIAIANANSKLWETRLNLLEQSRLEYKDNSRRLLLENETLHTQVQQTEKDTIDVVTFLRRKDQEKDDQIEQLQQQMKDLRRQTKKEKQDIINELSTQINDLETQLKQKNDEVSLMQSELKLVKEFRRKRAAMQKDLDEIKEGMFLANRDHKTEMTKMEQKFFEEKMRLQQEANQKIAELAEKAHTEAIGNLDETTRSVYKENVRITAALEYHMKEGDELKTIKKRLEEENTELSEYKELNEMMMHEKIREGKNQKEKIRQLEEKVETLEKALSHAVHEFEDEKMTIVHRGRVETESTHKELAKLQRMVELKNKEMNKVKRLARNILDQRTEMERFFLESLQQVKLEIAANQAQYRKAAQAAYQEKMLAAHAGLGEFPKIRTFNKSDTSTNSVFRDLEAAERLVDLSNKVDISDLTWEQKERVLRYLFAKMNGARDKNSSALPPIQAKPNIEPENTILSIKDKSESGGDQGDQTFLTQAQVDEVGSIKKPIIPDIPTQQESEPVA
ncbi:basal body-orientation factor 1-like isoform X1 [Tubulanus polymorphus]|uniref:basal body-orientation factor 1-like isoform X1 n=1 Tax=Tubulanus polymorphus TaxID=672921 RepID=UPI003DA64B7F